MNNIGMLQATTGGPRIARILGPKTIMLFGESCYLGTLVILLRNQHLMHWIKMFIFLTIKQLIFKRVRINFYEQKNEFSMTVAFIAPVAVTFILSFFKNC